MMKTVIGALIVSTAMATAPDVTWANESRVIEVEDAPLEIVAFDSKYRPEGTGRYASREAITHTLRLKNTSRKTIVAYGLGLHLFDVFDEAMGRGLNGLSIETIEPDMSVTGQWSDDPLSAFKFDKYGTSVAYVRQVRFEDGTVWKADLTEVLDELQDIESGLTMDAIDPGLPEQ